jgi:hypothetical protein
VREGGNSQYNERKDKNSRERFQWQAVPLKARWGSIVVLPIEKARKGGIIRLGGGLEVF